MKEEVYGEELDDTEEFNHRIEGMYCIRCHTSFPTGDYPKGCPHCTREGHFASIAFKYRPGGKIREKEKGMMRYADFLPYEKIDSLGEGGTPVIPVPALAKKLGIRDFFLKNEFQNPTGSHKDRTSPFAVRRAKERKIRTIAAASSGNAGASIAEYSAYAGLDCDIVVLGSVSPVWEAAIISTGAGIVRVSSPEERYELMDRKEKEGSWYITTNYLLHPVGSNAWGIQGYKTIAYEIYEEFGKDEIPDVILVPVARGDLLWGIYEGFREMEEEGWIDKLPRLAAVEPIPRIQQVLSGADYRGLFTGDDDLTPSIGGFTVTYQSKLAVEESGGTAVCIPQEEVPGLVREMAGYGFYLETSSAVILGALRKLTAAGYIKGDERVLGIATSHGFKNMPLAGIDAD